MQTSESIRLMFPFIELAERERIAVEGCEAATVFRNRLRENVGILPAGRGKILPIGPTQFVE